MNSVFYTSVALSQVMINRVNKLVKKKRVIKSFLYDENIFFLMRKLI